MMEIINNSDDHVMRMMLTMTKAKIQQNQNHMACLVQPLQVGRFNRFETYSINWIIYPEVIAKKMFETTTEFISMISTSTAV